MLETQRLLLRPLQADDVDAMLGIFGDPAVAVSFDLATVDHARMAQWVERKLKHIREHGYGVFVIILKATGEVIGDCGLQWMDVNGERLPELGYDFRSDHWHRGYATEAAMAVRDYAFATLGLERLISLIRVGNEAARRGAARNGMHLAEVTPGRYHTGSNWVYRIERSEWAARSGNDG